MGRCLSWIFLSQKLLLRTDIGIRPARGMFEVRSPKGAYRLYVTPPDSVNSAEDSDLHLSNLAVDAVNRLAVGIDVGHLQHVAQPALSYTLKPQARAHRGERPVTHAQSAPPLVGKANPDERVYFAAVTQHQGVDLGKHYPSASRTGGQTFEHSVRMFFERVRVCPHPLVDVLTSPEMGLASWFLIQDNFAAIHPQDTA